MAQDEFIINKGTDIRINPGCEVIFAEGGIQNTQGEFSNAGELTVEGNIINAGTLSGGSNSGTFRVLNDIENNGLMEPGQSLFELYGDVQVLRGSQQLNFYDLTLTGSGVKYMIQNIQTEGTLQLNGLELNASDNTVFHQNVNAASILSVHDEGFVSATEGGGLSRKTNGAQEYMFPLGSAVGTYRVRPVALSPRGGDNTYKLRFVNDQTPKSLQRGTELYYVNPKFSHYVERTEGTSSVDMSVFYDSFEDGFFQTLAHLEYTTDLWHENIPTVEGSILGTAPELVSFKTTDWGFLDPEIALAAWSTPIFVPNVFSPNEDGHNDIFKPRGTELYEFEMQIFDRWGNKVFESTSIDDGWDGTYNGTPMNSGVFVYYILSAGEVVDKGNVTLLR